MTLQVLISTMHQTDHTLLEKMNIRSDAVVINQCNRNQIEDFEFRGHHIKWISLSEKGVGLSRNTALMRATADVVLFADDDVSYVDNYEQIILDAFKRAPDAGMIVFNLECLNNNRTERPIVKNGRVGLYNSLKFGAYRMAARRNTLIINHVYFSLLFGGGAPYSAGEDNLLITDCIKKKIKVFQTTDSIGVVSHRDSSWFTGYNRKYFFDKGILLQFIFKSAAYPLGAAIVLKNRRIFGCKVPVSVALRYVFDGISYARKLRRSNEYQPYVCGDESI